MEAILFAIIALIFYTLFQVFIGQSGGKIDANLSAFIFNGLGAVIPISLYLLYKVSKKTSTIPTTKIGVLYSVLGGVAIAIFSIALVKAFEKGGNVSLIIPLVYGGSIVLATLIGRLGYGEKVDPWHLFGLGLIEGPIIKVVGWSRKHFSDPPLRQIAQHFPQHNQAKEDAKKDER